MSFEDDCASDYDYDDGCIKTWSGHDVIVSCATMYKDKEKHYFVLGSYETIIQIWDVDTGTCLRRLEGHTRVICCLAIHTYENGHYIVSGSHDKTIKIWDAGTGACLRTLRGHTSSVKSLTTYPLTKGYHIVSGSYDGTIKIWNGVYRFCLRTLEGHTGSVDSLATYQKADGGVCIVSGSHNKKGKIYIWDAGTYDTYVCLHILQGHNEGVSSITTYQDTEGQVRIVSGSWDETIKIWDAETGACLRTFKGHTHWVTSVAMSSDGRYILSGSYDQTIKVWDPTTGDNLRTFTGHTSLVVSLSVYRSEEGKERIVSASHRTMKLWEADLNPIPHRVLSLPPIHLATDAILDKTDDGTYVSPISLEELDPSRTVKLSDGHCYSYDDILAYYQEKKQQRRPFVSPLTRGRFTKEDIRLVKTLLK